jgi:hypothetical protein
MGDGQAMIRKITGFSLLVTSLLGLLPLACQPGGVGDPCTPEDEYNPSFSGYSPTEVNIESKSFQCETRLCLVNHFQGRVSCKYGQSTAQAMAATPPCHVPGNPNLPIQIPAMAGTPAAPVEVSPQLQARQADAAVYCSCRCDGPDSTARYCKCPSGYACEHLVDELTIPGAKGQLAGSYCVRDGTEYAKSQLQTVCVGDAPGADGTITNGTCGVATDG